MRRKHIWKRALATGCAGLLAAALLAGCGQTGTAGSSASAESGSISAESEAAPGGSYVVSEMSLNTDDMFTDRDLEGTYDEAEAVDITLSDDQITVSDENASGVSVSGQTVTISEAGVYVFTGTLSDGQIIVDADDAAKVQIVLNGCNITSKTSAAIYVRNADKVFLTMPEGTENTLANTDAYESDDDENINAVIYAKDDLTINGAGALTVSAANGNGIRAKDDLKLAGISLTINAANHAVNANDSIRVYSGTYHLTASKDALHAENTEDGEKGYLYIRDGSFTIQCDSDGMDASGMIQIDGGTMNIAAGDDGIHADAKLLVNDGTITISESYEGLEGYDVIINGGEIDITSDDDGINATAGGGSGMQGGFGKGGSGMGQMPGRGPGDDTEPDETSGQGTDEGAGENTGRPEKGSRRDRGGMPQDGDFPQDGELPETGEAPEDAGQQDTAGEQTGDSDAGTADASADSDGESTVSYTGDVDLAISGGVIKISAEGDGIDSNGTITITGGETYIDGPSGGGNGSMDVGDGYEATITGGIIIAAGADGMAETFGSDSTQGAILQSVNSTTGDVTLTDADGNVLVSFSPEKTYSSVLVSTPELTQGETYTLTTGGTETTIEMTELIYGQSQGMGGAGRGGFGGRQDPDSQTDSGQTDTEQPGVDQNKV